MNPPSAIQTRRLNDFRRTEFVLVIASIFFLTAMVFFGFRIAVSEEENEGNGVLEQVDDALAEDDTELAIELLDDAAGKEPENPDYL